MHAQIVPSGRTVYETPSTVFDPLAAEFGLDLDVAADSENAKCSRYFTEADDGLSRSWAPSRCWLNPPYGRGIERWVRKALDESRRGALVVALIPASTDTAWWHDYVMGASEIRLVRGRIRFVGTDHMCPNPHAVVIWTPRGGAVRLGVQDIRRTRAL